MFFFAFRRGFKVIKLLNALYAIITIRHGFLIHLHLLDPSASLKPSPFRLRFQHHLPGPADVNAWKNMFDPYTS